MEPELRCNPTREPERPDLQLELMTNVVVVETMFEPSDHSFLGI